MKRIESTPETLSAIPGASPAASLEQAKGKGGQGPRMDGAKLDKAAREFEAYFVQYMMKEMRKGVHKSELLGGQETTALFESMMDENLGKVIAEGQGLGLARQLRDSIGAYLGDNEKHKVHLPRYEAAPAQVGYPVALRSMGPGGMGGFNPYASQLDELDHLPHGVSSGFGERTHPIFGEKRFHAGVDIPMPEGTPVRAAAEGVVTFAGEQRGYGNVVIVEHADGYTTRYAHNSKLLVEEGQLVGADTLLAESGSTGWTTGPHLHFEVRKDGEPVDPTKVAWVRLP